MCPLVVHEVDRLHAQLVALERENERLKETLAVQADRLVVAERDARVSKTTGIVAVHGCADETDA